MLELLEKRRSIRKYIDKPVEAEKVEMLKKAAILAPSSRSLRPLEFIFIQNQETLKILSHSKHHGSSFLAAAPLGVAVIARESKSDVWIEDAAIASIVIQLAAESLGLKSCWIQIRLRETEDGVSSEAYIKEKLGIPEEYRVLSLLSIGYPDETKPPYGEAFYSFKEIHNEGF